MENWSGLCGHGLHISVDGFIGGLLVCGRYLRWLKSLMKAFTQYLIDVVGSEKGREKIQYICNSRSECFRVCRFSSCFRRRS